MKKQQKGILVILSGFSGAGKGTIMNLLMNRYQENYALSISATTRKPREGEQEGREYFFKTREEFEKMIEKNELIEYALYVENYYGTPRAYVEKQLEAGRDVILEIEIQGARKIKAMFPDTLLLFVSSIAYIYALAVGLDRIYAALVRAVRKWRGKDEKTA